MVSQQVLPRCSNRGTKEVLKYLWNVYSFFVLYANIDGFNPKEYEMAVEDRTDIDKWIISRLNNTIKTVRTNLDNYNITPAARAIDDLVDDISNWYLRRSRSGIGSPKLILIRLQHI